MEIKKDTKGTSLTLSLAGRLDAKAARELDKELKSALDGVSELTIDFRDLIYVASAGLRSLLTAQKRMESQGSMKILHVAPQIREVFEVTGFCEFLHIEN